MSGDSGQTVTYDLALLLVVTIEYCIYLSELSQEGTGYPLKKPPSNLDGKCQRLIWTRLYLHGINYTVWLLKMPSQAATTLMQAVCTLYKEIRTSHKPIDMKHGDINIDKRPMIKSPNSKYVLDIVSARYEVHPCKSEAHPNVRLANVAPVLNADTLSYTTFSGQISFLPRNLHALCSEPNCVRISRQILSACVASGREVGSL